MTLAGTRPVAALLAVCGLVAAGGGALAVNSLMGSDTAPLLSSNRSAAVSTHQGPHGVGDDVLTSFGAVSVDVAKKIPGLTSKEVGGVTHYPSYIPPDKMLVQVTVTVTNLTPKILPVRSSKLFNLVSGTAAPMAPVTNTLLSSLELQPSASVEGILGFIVPAKGQKLQVQVNDPGASAQVVQIGPAVSDISGRKSATPLDHNEPSHP
jgi:hypothetical protein